MSGRNTKIAPRKLGCRFSNDNTDERFVNPLLRVWCSKDAPPEDWEPVDRLGEMPKYYGYYERVGE